MVLISLQTRVSNLKLAVKVKVGGGEKALSDYESFSLEIRFLTVIAE